MLQVINKKPTKTRPHLDSGSITRRTKALFPYFPNESVKKLNGSRKSMAYRSKRVIILKITSQNYVLFMSVSVEIALYWFWMEKPVYKYVDSLL